MVYVRSGQSIATSIRIVTAFGGSRDLGRRKSGKLSWIAVNLLGGFCYYLIADDRGNVGGVLWFPDQYFDLMGTITRMISTLGSAAADSMTGQ